MNLKIEGQSFLVTGASSGLGRAMAERLAEEGGFVLAVARREDALKELVSRHEERIKYLSGDVREIDFINKIMHEYDNSPLHGVFVNAGGPPAGLIRETGLTEWDEAYRLLIRWKVALVQGLLPHFTRQKYGRILFSESRSVNQPIENLVLSNSLRMAIVGFAKTISLEYASESITANVIAPGYHDTQALNRLFKKKSQQLGISYEEAETLALSNIPAGKFGRPEDFASLAAWLLSPHSEFVNAQVFTLDGGAG
jgi:3-oxoacyl-[acyl-carrier protein] reductase